MATDFNISQRTLQAGVPGEFIAPNIPAASPGYRLTIQQVGWAHTGGDALFVGLDASYDGGQTWLNLTEDTLPDEAVPAVKTFPADSFRVAASLDPQVGNTKRQLKLRWNAIKTVTISGTVTAL